MTTQQRNERMLPKRGLTLQWRDESTCSLVHIDRPDGTMHKLTVHAPNEYCEVWTAQAELLSAEFRQLKFSGLLNGGSTRESAKAAALIALRKV